LAILKFWLVRREIPRLVVIGGEGLLDLAVYSLEDTAGFVRSRFRMRQADD
jgi:hypothetical protein